MSASPRVAGRKQAEEYTVDDIDDFAPGDPFCGMRPEDGYRVDRVELGRSLALYVKIVQGGRTFNDQAEADSEGRLSDMAAFWRDDRFDSLKSLGAGRRVELVVDSLCRYFTTGGDWDELDAALAQLRRVITGGLAYPGYYLIHSDSNTDGTYEHRFLAEDENDLGVIWIEDRCIVPQLRADLEQQVEAFRQEDAGGGWNDTALSPLRPQLGHHPEEAPD